jgi:hypothetical protein
MNKLKTNIYLGLTTLALIFSPLSPSAVFAQRDDERPVGELAEQVGAALQVSCEEFTDAPENHGRTYTGRMFTEDSTVAGFMLGGLCEGVYFTAYRALLYDYVTVNTIQRSGNPQETRDNAYSEIRRALLRSRDVRDGLNLIAGSPMVTPDAGEAMAEMVIYSVVQTYALTEYGIEPPQANASRATNGNSPTNASRGVNRYEFSTNSHVNTGISVNPGDVVSIRGSGTIRFGLFAGSGGPNGITFNPQYNYFVDIPHGQLIGRVKEFGMGDFAGWFSVAGGTEFVVQGQGVLEFAVNDNQPSDNAGSFLIEVTIESGQN